MLALGYMNGFYSSGATRPAAFWGSTFADLSFTVRPTMLSRVVLGYRHDFENSVISNFYYNETGYASYVQQIAGRLALDLSGRYVAQELPGPVRSDPTLTTGVPTTSSRSARRSTTSCATGSTPVSATALLVNDGTSSHRTAGRMSTT